MYDTEPDTSAAVKATPSSASPTGTSAPETQTDSTAAPQRVMALPIIHHPNLMHVQALQRTLGNLAVNHLLARRPIQSHRAAGATHNTLDQEVGRGVQTPAYVQHKGGEGNAVLAAQRPNQMVQQAEGRVQATTQMKDGVPVNNDEALKHEADVMGAKALVPAPGGAMLQRTVTAPSPSGDSLPSGVQARMERSFGIDFSAVRVHQGAEAASLGAHAFTRGDDIHFAPGAYDASSHSGQSLLGHELTHVVQQRAGQVAAPQSKDAPINDDPVLEAEANVLGERAASGQVIAPRGHGVAANSIVQRQKGLRTGQRVVANGRKGVVEEPIGSFGAETHYRVRLDDGGAVEQFDEAQVDVEAAIGAPPMPKDVSDLPGLSVASPSKDGPNGSDALRPPEQMEQSQPSSSHKVSTDTLRGREKSDEDLFERFHAICIGLLMNRFKAVQQRARVKTISDLNRACLNWYRTNLLPQTRPVIAKHIEQLLLTHGDRNPKDPVAEMEIENVERSVLDQCSPICNKVEVPTPEVVQGRERHLLIPILKELGQLRDKVQGRHKLDQTDTTIVARYILGTFENDLNLYRPDFDAWFKDQGFLNSEDLKVLFGQTLNTAMLPGEKRRRDFVAGTQAAIRDEEDTEFIPFDQGMELASTVLSSPEHFPPSVWSGVCEAKVLRVLAYGDFKMGTKLQVEDALLQAEYIANEGAKDMFMREQQLKEVPGPLQYFSNGDEAIAELVKVLKARDSHMPFNLGLQNKQSGGHAIAAQKLKSGKYNFYDPNVGVQLNISPEVFKNIWDRSYGKLGYTGFVTSDYLPIHEADEILAKRRLLQEEEERSKPTETAPRPKMQTGRRLPTRVKPSGQVPPSTDTSTDP